MSLKGEESDSYAAYYFFFNSFDGFYCIGNQRDGAWQGMWGQRVSLKMNKGFFVLLFSEVLGVGPRISCMLALSSHG